jgi:hypothetical protein
VDRDPAAQLAGFPDHALPRQLIGGLRGLERSGRDPRAARDARELGDLAVGRDAPPGDRADHLLDRLEQLLEVLGVR